MSGTPARKSKHLEKQDSKNEPSEVTRRSTTTSTPYNRSSPSKRKPGSATSGSTRASGASRRKTALGENDALGRSNAALGESESVWGKTNVARRKRSAWGRGSVPLEKPDDLLPQAHAVLHGTASKKVGLETFAPSPTIGQFRLTRRLEGSKRSGIAEARGESKPSTNSAARTNS